MAEKNDNVEEIMRGLTSDIMSKKDLDLTLREIPEEEYEYMEYHFGTSTSKITKGNASKLAVGYKTKIFAL